MREAGEVADDRADRAAAPAAGREQMPRRAGAAHLGGDLAGQLEHLPVQEEEATQAELLDQRELFCEASLGGRVSLRVALPECGRADAVELHGGGIGPVREVGIAVAELLREVEFEPLGQLHRRVQRVAVVRPAGDHLGRGEQRAFVVSAPVGLAAFERRAALDRDEHVLELHPGRVVRMRVPGDDRAQAERRGQVAQRVVAAGVAPAERTLELHEEALRPERLRQAGGAVRVVHGQSEACAAGEADEPVGVLGERLLVEARLAALRRVRPG